MKWGVRRERRTLDRLAGRKPGKARPSKKEQDANRAKKRASNKSARSEHREAQKNRRSLSDTDIRSRIDRLKLEKELTSLTNENLSPIRTKLTTTLTNAGWDVAQNTAKAGMTVLTRKYLAGETLTREEIGKYLKPKK